MCIDDLCRILVRLGERAEKRIGKMLSGYAIVTLDKGSMGSRQFNCKF